MKLIALTLAALACTLTGHYFAGRLARRVNLLEKLELMLDIVLSEVRFISAPADEIINTLSQKSELSELVFLKLCNKELNNGHNFRQAWKCSIDNLSATNDLRSDDIEILHLFGQRFGTTDVQGQVSLCTMLLNNVKCNIEEARENKRKYSAVFCGLGFLCGIGVIILLI